MIKIICTEIEKEIIIRSLSDIVEECPFIDDQAIKCRESCKVCVEKNIEWEVI